MNGTIPTKVFIKVLHNRGIHISGSDAQKLSYRYEPQGQGMRVWYNLLFKELQLNVVQPEGIKINKVTPSTIESLQVKK